MNGKKALVISGGGAKGAFAIGALRYIYQEQGITFDLVAGTSTGSLIAPFIVSDNYREVRRNYLTLRTEDFIKSNGEIELLRGGISVFDTTPLKNKIDEQVDDEVYREIERKGQRDGVQMFITTVPERLFFFNPGHGELHHHKQKSYPLTLMNK